MESHLSYPELKLWKEGARSFHVASPARRGGTSDAASREPIDAAGMALRTMIVAQVTAAVIAQGRLFTDADDGDGPPVAMVSESVAERYWPGQKPIGRRARFTAQFPWTTVMGVAADARYRELTRD